MLTVAPSPGRCGVPGRRPPGQAQPAASPAPCSWSTSPSRPTGRAGAPPPSRAGPPGSAARSWPAASAAAGARGRPQHQRAVVVGRLGGRTQGYLRTVDDIHDALKTVGASAESGELDTLFAQAMNDYWTNHYSAAVSLYQRVLNLYDGHLLARKYLTLAQAEADGPDDIPLPRPQAADVKQDSNTRTKVLALALLAVLVAALVLLLALPVAVWLRRGSVRQRSRRRLTREPAGWGTAATGNGRSDEPPAPADDGLPFGDGQTVAARAAGPAATKSQNEGASP